MDVSDAELCPLAELWPRMLIPQGVTTTLVKIGTPKPPKNRRASRAGFRGGLGFSENYHESSPEWQPRQHSFGPAPVIMRKAPDGRGPSPPPPPPPPLVAAQKLGIKNKRQFSSNSPMHFLVTPRRQILNLVLHLVLNLACRFRCLSF